VKKKTILLALTAVVSVTFAERRSFSHYQSIVDRQMFGALPPGFDPTKLPSEVSKTEQKQLTQEQEKLQSAIHFSVINVAPDGSTVVGFTDNSDPKSPVHYYLKVGESRNGWEVREADAAAATMTIAKGDVEVSLSLGGNSAKGGGTTAKVGEANAAGAGRKGGGLLGGSLGARRRMRAQLAQEEQAKRDAAAAVKEVERLAQVEEEKAQREAERAEQRQQLLAIQEELKRVRETKVEAEKGKDEPDGGAEKNDEN